MFVVTGATGNVGRSVVRILASAGERVIATSRGVSAADVPDGVRHVRADLADADGLRPLFEGADAVFLQSGGASAERLSPRDLVDAAKAGGVGRIVLLSSQGVATRPDSASHGKTARRFEDAVRDSGLEWTILRPGGFASNSFAWIESVRARREIAAPFADTGLPVIDPDDIAEVGAAALREDGHVGEILELTGPVLSTPRERAAALSEALGEPIRFVPQTREEAYAEMVRFLPEPVVVTTLDILGAPIAAEQRISPDVERVLGRAPRPFAEWAARNAEAFR
ncbi:NAD(P)H-binding protein [Streptomyces tritici]|uniref:NAD(P)H-binding protein n=1 Tax=Streptomyces tritici TaxID=2054410 RepID=UPI003AF1B7CA